MEIKVENNVPDLNVTVNQNEDGTFAILLAAKNKKTLGSVNPGQTVKLGNREYIVLGHEEETTAVITKECTKEMMFGKNGDYTESYVREYCNSEFYEELVKAVGKDNIVKQTVNLMADDGTGNDMVVHDNVSILTTDLYRRYRTFLPSYDNWCTATRSTYNSSHRYCCCICCIDSDGVLFRGVCNAYSRGIFPFCILNSSVNVG